MPSLGARHGLAMILVLAGPDDNHVLPVAEELRRRGVEVVHFDLAEFPKRASMTVELPRGRASITRESGERIDLARVQTIWARRLWFPEVFEFSDATFALAEWRHAWTGLAQMLRHKRWINPLASYFLLDGGWGKLRQLEAARTLGLHVPRTLVSTDPERVRAFVEGECRGLAIAKPFTSTWKTVEGEKRVLWSTRTSEFTDALGYGRFANAPMIVQELVPKRLEIRATVFGEKVFACGLESAHLADYRTNYLGVPRACHTLPREVEQKLVALHRELGIEMSSTDLILTPEGEYVLLDINVQGTWVWCADVFEPGEMIYGFCDFLTKPQ